MKIIKNNIFINLYDDRLKVLGGFVCQPRFQVLNRNLKIGLFCLRVFFYPYKGYL